MKIITLLFLLSSMSACVNLFNKKSDLDFELEAGPRSGQSNQTDFSDISREILVPHCIKCHSKYVNYSSVYSERSRILSSVINNRMPKKASPLSSKLKTLLKEWINAGAVRSRDDGGNSGNNKVPSGLSEEMQRLYKIHLNKQPVLDDEKKLVLSTEGENEEYDLGEGRVAEVKYVIGDTIKLVTRIDLIENTCHKNFTPKACIFVAHGKNYIKRLAWIKHPMASKINKVVEYAYPPNEGEERELSFQKVEESDYYSSSAVKLLSPTLDQGVQDYIICDDWNWAGGDNLKILSWGSEQMLANAETNLNENRVAGGMYDFNIKKFDKNIMRMTAPKFIESRLGRTTLAAIVGEAGSFFYEGDNEQCMVGFKFDFNTLVMSLRSQEETYSDNHFKTYRKKQDNTFNREGDQFINFLIDGAQTGVVR